jgi:hypothetical protein
MRDVSFAAVLLFSLSSSIGLWDADLLSESLALSLMALLVATLLTLARRPTVLLGVAAVAAATLWAGTRDTNAYAVVLLAPLAGAAIWRDGRIRLAVVVAGAFVAAGGTAIAASASTARSELLLVDVVDERVLDEPAARAFFVERGLPVRPDLRRALFARRSVLTRYEQDSELANVREWLTRHGGRRTSRPCSSTRRHPSATSRSCRAWSTPAAVLEGPRFSCSASSPWGRPPRQRCGDALLERGWFRSPCS